MVVNRFLKICCRSLSSECMSTFENATVTPILGPFLIAEGPHWDQERQSLYFVDIMGKSFNRYVPATKFYKKVEMKETVSFIIPVKGTPDQFILGLGTKVVLLTWGGLTVTHTISDLKSTTTCVPPITRLNDGKADHLGNVWFGSMGKEDEKGIVAVKKGKFFRLKPNRKFDIIEKEVTISNGIAWNNDRTLMYYIDSPLRRVDVFDYDSETGEVDNRRIFFDFKKENILGIPDGMTTDCNDNLWIACWGACQVIRVSSRTGIVLGSLKIPAQRVTSLIFGGPDMNTLYVTSMKWGLYDKQLKIQPYAGYVFEVKGLSTCDERITGAMSHSALFEEELIEEIEPEQKGPCDDPEPVEEEITDEKVKLMTCMFEKEPEKKKEPPKEIVVCPRTKIPLPPKPEKTDCEKLRKLKEKLAGPEPGCPKKEDETYCRKKADEECQEEEK